MDAWGLFASDFWLSADYFAAVLNWVHYLLQVGAEGRDPGDELLEGVNNYDLSAPIIPFILGIVLLLNGRKMGALPCATRRAE